MDIYILRHAVAEARTKANVGQDASRVLTGDGARKMRQIASGILRQGWVFDAILSSPYTRARETAMIVAEALKCEQSVTLSAALAPDAPPSRLWEEINRAPAGCRSVLLVGHEPDLTQLISLLLVGKPGVGLQLKKGGMAKLAVGMPLQPGGATLEWLLTPRQLRDLV